MLVKEGVDRGFQFLDAAMHAAFDLPSPRRRDLSLIVARLLGLAAKLATARMRDSETASHSLSDTIGLSGVTAREIYTTLDWLGSEQVFIENQLARRHLTNGTLVLYDVTSTSLNCRIAKTTASVPQAVIFSFPTVYLNGGGNPAASGKNWTSAGCAETSGGAAR